MVGPSPDSWKAIVFPSMIIDFFASGWLSILASVTAETLQSHQISTVAAMAFACCIFCMAAKYADGYRMLTIDINR